MTETLQIFFHYQNFPKAFLLCYLKQLSVEFGLQLRSLDGQSHCKRCYSKAQGPTAVRLLGEGAPLMFTLIFIFPHVPFRAKLHLSILCSPNHDIPTFTKLSLKMAQGAVKKLGRPTPAKVTHSKKQASKVNKSKGTKKSVDKVHKKFTSGMTARTEALLGERAGHLELLGKGNKKKDKKTEYKGGSKKFG